MLSFLTFLSIVLIVYAYVGYPLALSLLSRPPFRSPGHNQNQLCVESSRDPRFTVIIAARNEERVIREKINNTLALRSSSPVQFVVASDCSDDATDEIALSFPGVELSRSPERKGKEFAQALAVARATGDIVIFTDAKVKLNPDALERFTDHFSDPTVGAVSSIDRVEGEGSGEGFYVRYEMFLRRLETRYRTLVGLSGSCFAVRRDIADALRTDVPSDFALLLETIKRGLRGVLAEDVICTYRAVASDEEEFVRKVRTILRGITTFFVCREVLDARRFGSFTWQIVSHKLLRWLVPWFLIFGTIGSLALASDSLFYLLCSDGFLLLYGGAFFGFVRPELRRHTFIKVPLFFIITNTSILIAWLKYFQGARSITWTPSQKTEGMPCGNPG